MSARTMIVKSSASAPSAARLRRKRRQAPGGGGAPLSIDVNAAVEPRISKIGEEVHDDQQGAINDRHAEQEIAIASEHRLDEKRPGPGNVENRFHDDRAG